MYQLGTSRIIGFAIICSLFRTIAAINTGTIIDVFDDPTPSGARCSCDKDIFQGDPLFVITNIENYVVYMIFLKNGEFFL